MKKKIIVILVCLLFVINVLTVSKVISINTIQKINEIQISEIFINDNFNTQDFGFGFEPLSELIDSDPLDEYGEDPPTEFDWRNYNGQDWTTTARNQASCGSCWDFAAHSCLEAVINIVEGDSALDLDLSEQYILSCYSGGWGCGGSNAYYAYEYMYDNGGAIPELCFTYSANDNVPCSSKCADWQDKLVPITNFGYSNYPPINNIKNKIVADGPVCVSFSVYSDFYAGSPSFDSNGVYQHKSGSYQAGHQVAAVGYVDTPGNPEYDGYWICKNSWGATWGPWNDGCFGIAYGEVGIDEDIVWVEYSSTAPDTSIISGPLGSITYNDVTFEWIGSDANTPVEDLVYSYILEGYDSSWSSWESITSKTYTDLDNGAYTFKVKTKDEVVIPDYSPATQSFSVDIPLYSLTVNINGQGSVAKNPDKTSYPEGMTVELTAAPEYGWAFDHWEGDLSSTNNPETITFNDDKTVTAYFIQLPEYTLTINVIGQGSVIKNPDLTSYPEGMTVELTAVPESGWVFDYWEGDLSSSNNPETIAMNEDKTINVVFYEIIDVLDQEQDQYDTDYLIYRGRWVAQSFKPTTDTLSKVDLFFGKIGSPPDNIFVYIRKSLAGTDLTSISISSTEIPSSMSWVEFDFSDIEVTPGDTYYIVVRTLTGSRLNCYTWGYSYNNPYPDGIFHFSIHGDAWYSLPSYDFCFRTYSPGSGPPVPVLLYFPTSYDFGNLLEGVTDSISFDVWNSGTGILTYSLSESCGWVSISPAGGDSSGEHDSITVEVDSTGLDVGVYHCDISISSEGGSGVFGVDLEVVTPSPILTYDPISHDFGDMLVDETDSINFDVWNSGTGTLTYSLSESCSWIEASPISGDSAGEHDSITVTVDTTGLSLGAYHCDISISSNGGNDVFSVDINIVVPSLENLDQEQDQSSNSYLFYSNRWLGQSFKPALDTLSKVDLLISKKGNPTNDMVVSIRSSLTGGDLGSVSLSPSGIPNDADWVEFDFDDIDVTPGNTYYIVVRSVGNSWSDCYLWSYGYNTPYTDGAFQFSLNSGASWIEFSSYDFCFRTYGPGGGPPVPVLSSDPTSYDFGNMLEGVADSTSFDVWNSGTGTLTYSLSESCSWVDVSPISGDSTGEHDSIAVTVDTTDLIIGTHHCDISISSNGGSGVFGVDLEVVEPIPILSYDPISHDFGDMLEDIVDSTSFDIWNSGTDVLTYSINEDCSWVTVSPPSGDSTGEHDTITVTVDTTGLSLGAYHCDIGISSNGGNDVFSIDVNVIPEAADSLDQEQPIYTNVFSLFLYRFAAQSFIPELDVLTRVELYVKQLGSPTDDLVVSIRDDLYGSDLTSISIPAGDIPTSLDWVEFDFSDLSVTPGNTYYIVMYTTDGSSSQGYQIGYASGNPYVDGSYWYSSDFGSSWSEFSVYDLTFKTYGYNGNDNLLFNILTKILNIDFFSLLASNFQRFK